VQIKDIRDLMSMWTEDSKLDRTDLLAELSRIDSLHAKYLNIHTTHSILWKKAMREYSERKRFWSNYYSGEYNDDKDFLKEHSLEPMHKKVLRSEIQEYLDSNEELNNILMKKMIHEEISSYGAEVVKQVRQRSYEVKSYIDYEKFLNGG
jgi:Recombination, repair and ssDNA binding protein UvsY